MTATRTSTTSTAPRHVRVGILGAGFAGLGMAIRLKQEGEDDFVVWERAADVGGTWWANSYPGCQCDIPSHLYSFSFAPNPEWRRTYAPQPEIQAYIRRVADDFRIRPHVRLNCAVTAASWDDVEHVWRVATERGDYTAEALVAAPGPLSEPSIPRLPGLDSFAGTVFHTATWKHDHDLSGRRVAVVGTGASAIQVVPEIQPLVEHLTVFQRTPPWVVPHGDRPIAERERQVFRRFPAAQRAVRAGVYLGRELLVPGLAYRPGLMTLIERLARRHLRRQVSDPELRRRLTPDYAIGCKRILPSNRWYPAVTQPNVEVVTDGIARVRPDGIVDASGALHRVDTIIFATGFHATDVRIAALTTGTRGRRLSDVWNGSPQAYRGTTVAGFPNLFFLVGPNTGLGHNSIVFMIEAQLNYVAGALQHMRRRGATKLEVTRAAQDAYNARIQRRMAQTVWSTGCSSWYLDRTGRNSTIWPDFTFRFWADLRRFDPSAYHLGRTSRRTRDAPVAAAA
ncbi:MAG TPA: NAD(P)/FAD-dependent oxidoreductase [Solirubrobacteraceae bacterium]|nr:NAD(P)/FAD-dependent oxidoreductase [Solirubrobacteraceae bacterium]